MKSNVPRTCCAFHSGCEPMIQMRHDLNRVESAKVLLPAAIDRLAFQFQACHQGAYLIVGPAGDPRGVNGGHFASRPTQF